MGGVWGPQVCDYEIRCPYCGSERCRIRWCLRSLLRMAAQFGMYFVWRLMEPFRQKMLDKYLFNWKLLRRCRECDAFFDPVAPPIREPECGRCGCDLAQSEGDRCPECGWRIPGPIRVLRLRQSSRRRLV